MARDPRISEIFYYFEQYTNIASGRTVGRKIGVVQEILCKKLLLTSERIQDSILYEPKLPGRSGATHKVEFVIVQPVSAAELSVGESLSLRGLSIKLVQIDQQSQRARIEINGQTKSRRMVSEGRLLKLKDFTSEESEHVLKIVRIQNSAIRIAVLNPQLPVASIESKRVGAQRFSGSDKLGSGIQTIEKAKQASLVAVDFDLNFNGTLLAQSKPGASRRFRSFVILGNGVHWTPHDLAILETYVDSTYLAEDQAILRYAEFVREQAIAKGDDFFKSFMQYFQGMTKTPPDAFMVHDSDFTAVCPKNAGPLLTAVENQILSYPVSIVRG